MKLVAFCVVLLLFSTFVIYKQKQKLDGLAAALDGSNAQIVKLQQALEVAKNEAAQPATTTAQPGVPAQARRPASGSWMLENHQNPLEAPAQGSSRKR